MMNRSERVLVLGIGNTLFTDDGFGILAVQAAEALWEGPDGVDFSVAMAGGLELMDLLAGYGAALVVDAAVTGHAAPGELYLLNVQGLAAAGAGGAHGAHLGTALETARRLGITMPARLKVLAAEAQNIYSFGEQPTAAVAAAIGPAAVLIGKLARSLLQGVSVGA
ncbi:MAG TPA: hydrogenase maturation protease [Symbiobacteriaceae bacterium]|nr:hydrogenase maturation protease [Symbiobacteriaceae bacterium]